MKTLIFQCYMQNIINDKVQDFTNLHQILATMEMTYFLSHDQLVDDPGSERVVLCTVLMGC